MSSSMHTKYISDFHTAEQRKNNITGRKGVLLTVILTGIHIFLLIFIFLP